MSEYTFDWADLAFGSKKPVKELRATFIAAPRELSAKRFKQIIKTYLPQGNIVLGMSKEPFVDGFEGQPQFRMLQLKTIKKTVELVNGQDKTPGKIYILNYLQRELPFLISNLGFKQVVLVRGSWKHVFHMSPAYYGLVQKRIPYEMISPFTDEDEARAYAAKIALIHDSWEVDHFHHDTYSEKGMFEFAATAAKLSFDYSFQTGLALGKESDQEKGRYAAICVACNEVVPFSTYAMHYGNQREDNLSPANDLNYYDTNHAEVDLIVGALEKKVDLTGTTLFINLLPCPTCARMLSQTGIKEFVYNVDHSDGYAVKMLEAAGKRVRRVVL